MHLSDCASFPCYCVRTQSLSETDVGGIHQILAPKHQNTIFACGKDKKIDGEIEIITLVVGDLSSCAKKLAVLKYIP